MRRRDLMRGLTCGSAAVLRAAGGPALARGDDDPGPPAIDTHIHFFRTAATRQPAGAAEGRPAALPGDWQQAAHPCGVRQVVVIEASPAIEDNQWLLDLAAVHPWIVGIVGRLPIGEQDCGRLVERFAAQQRFRGVRLGSDAILAGLERAAFLRDLERLADRGLVVDVIGPTQLVAAERLAARIPQLRVLLEHMAGATIAGDAPDPRWLDGLAAAARHPDTYLKVSHVIQSADRDATSPGLDRYAPWLEAVWQAFGDDRVVFGTDWPVSQRHATYARIHDLVRQFVTRRPADVARQFFAENARRAYGLVEPG